MSVQSNEGFDFKEFIGQCLSKWYWFAFSILLCLGIGTFHILKTPKVYSRTATVLIKETATRRSSNELETMLNAGGMNQMNSKLPNEIIALQSPDLMKSVVERLNLDYNYAIDGKLKKYVIYGSSLPFKVELIGYDGPASLEVTPLKDSTYRISGISRPDGRHKKKDAKTYTVAACDTVQTEIGGITVVPSPTYTGSFDSKVYVTHNTIAAATRSYNARLHAAAVDMKNYSDILNLSFSDQSTQRAEDVLNTVINVYNENWVDDRNKIAVSTSMFINDRLVTLENELGTVDSDISSYKSKNMLPDVAAASNMYMTQSSETNKALQDLDNQLYSARYLRNYLANNLDDKQLIPASSMLSNSSLSSQISAYNSALLERNNLVAGSSEQNPLVMDLDANLAAMRASILTSVDNHIATLQAEAGSLQRAEQQATSRLADNPNQAKYLLSVERQQKVKESLYLFLLQKREENELSQAFTAYNTRVITRPTGSSAPTEPQSSRILLIAFLLGLLIPAAVIYLQETLNTKLRGRKDLEGVSVPLISEIPQHFPGRKTSLRRARINAEDAVVVKPGKRDQINEAFRVMRTNIEFMMKDSSNQVFGVTSFNPKSGKTFITMNLAQSLAIKNIKVVVVDCDLRHPSSSKYVGTPDAGLTDYLVGDVQDYHTLVQQPEGCQGLDVISVGTVPPNPSELLSSDRLSALVAQLRQDYEVVLLDCPPVDIVADTQLISPYFDRTIFVVRAGLLERSMIPEIDELADRGMYKNLSMVLNGTQAGTSKYGSSYGYRYGYRYGYASSDYYSSDKEK